MLGLGARPSTNHFIAPAALIGSARCIYYITLPWERPTGLLPGLQFLQQCNIPKRHHQNAADQTAHQAISVGVAST
jgi:hypothetical protein